VEIKMAFMTGNIDKCNKLLMELMHLVIYR